MAASSSQHQPDPWAQGLDPWARAKAAQAPSPAQAPTQGPIAERMESQDTRMEALEKQRDLQDLATNIRSEMGGMQVAMQNAFAESLKAELAAQSQDLMKAIKSRPRGGTEDAAKKAKTDATMNALTVMAHHSVGLGGGLAVISVPLSLGGFGRPVLLVRATQEVSPMCESKDSTRFGLGLRESHSSSWTFIAFWVLGKHFSGKRTVW